MASNFTEADDWQVTRPHRIVVSVVFGCILLTGIIGNVLVITLVLLVKTMRSVVNVCLVSLALADLIVLVFLPVLPFSRLYELNESFLGNSFCVFITSIDRGAVLCSSFTFILVAVERYTVLCYPLKTIGLWTHGKVCLLLALIWTTAASVCIPYGATATFSDEYNNNTWTYCHISWHLTWLQKYETAMLCLSFFLPIFVLMALYGKMICTLKARLPQSDTQGSGIREAHRARSRTTVMLVIVVVIFVVCLLPFEIVVLVATHNYQAWEQLDSMTSFVVLWFSRMMAYVYHAASPIVYFCMSGNFRTAFRDLFCKCYGNPEKTNESTVISAVAHSTKT